MGSEQPVATVELSCVARLRAALGARPCPTRRLARLLRGDIAHPRLSDVLLVARVTGADPAWLALGGRA